MGSETLRNQAYADYHIILLLAAPRDLLADLNENADKYVLDGEYDSQGCACQADAGALDQQVAAVCSHAPEAQPQEDRRQVDASKAEERQKIAQKRQRGAGGQEQNRASPKDADDPGDDKGCRGAARLDDLAVLRRPLRDLVDALVKPHRPRVVGVLGGLVEYPVQRQEVVRRFYVFQRVRGLPDHLLDGATLGRSPGGVHNKAQQGNGLQEEDDNVALAQAQQRQNRAGQRLPRHIPAERDRECQLLEILVQHVRYYLGLRSEGGLSRQPVYKPPQVVQCNGAAIKRQYREKGANDNSQLQAWKRDSIAKRIDQQGENYR